MGTEGTSEEKVMITLHKKLVLDQDGNPTEVIIPYDEFKELEEILGLDLEDEVKGHLREAARERKLCKEEAYVGLDDVYPVSLKKLSTQGLIIPPQNPKRSTCHFVRKKVKGSPFAEAVLEGRR